MLHTHTQLSCICFSMLPRGESLSPPVTKKFYIKQKFTLLIYEPNAGKQSSVPSVLTGTEPNIAHRFLLDSPLSRLSSLSLYSSLSRLSSLSLDSSLSLSLDYPFSLSRLSSLSLDSSFSLSRLSSFSLSPDSSLSLDSSLSYKI